MTDRFFGGPYDGMEIELPTDLNPFCNFLSIPSDEGNRQFVEMPSPQDWDRIARGEITKDDFRGGTIYPYEREANGYHYARLGSLKHTGRPETHHV